MSAITEPKLLRHNFVIRWLVIATHKLLGSRYIYRWSKHKGPVLFIFSRFCIKSTSFTALAEAEAMRFISQDTSIPVPKVYCAFKHRGRVYIVMECIQGQTLCEGWVRRPQESKDKILQSLRSMIQQMRSLPPPSDIGVANVSGGPIFDQRLPDKSFWGPFPSVREFHLGLCNGLAEAAHLKPELAKLLDFHNQPWPTTTFTHGDPSSLNIMARGDEIAQTFRRSRCC
jgi:hypothetical protein